MANLRGTEDEDSENLIDYLRIDPKDSKRYLYEGIEKDRETYSTTFLKPGQILGPIDLDPKIEPIIDDLASSGFVTIMSCSGLSSDHPYAMCNTARIGFGGRYSDLTPQNRKDIRGIIRRHTSVPFIFKKSKVYGPIIDFKRSLE